MKKVFIIFLLIIMNTVVYAGESTYIPYTEPDVSYNIKPANVKVKFIKGESNNSVFCNGRLCVPLVEGVKAIGGELSSTVNGYKISADGKNISLKSAIVNNRPVIFTYDNVEYISLYELITPFEYEALVNLSENSVDILKEVYDGDINTELKLNNNCNEAYIRLEDIVADGLKPGEKGKYSVDMLEKLKYTSKYLYDRNQEYYIAWIPVYVYPKGNYQNDVSKDYNLYNSYFLYVLDYMTEHNGHIGLHGYTHQYGDEESAIGYEWGKNTPYDVKEQQRRMVAAKETCHKLGYNDEFFEFPHYGATDEQMVMAENYFDAIYQSYPNEKLYNYFTYTNRSGHNVYYIPTPADYVHYIRDISIFDKIKNSVIMGYTLSLFFHPVIDENQFDVETYDNKRIWKYSEEGSLPGIVSYVSELGYKFSDFR